MAKDVSKRDDRMSNKKRIITGKGGRPWGEGIG